MLAFDGNTIVEHFNIPTILRARADQKSFHVVSERHVRIEFRNLNSQEAIGPFAYAGDLVVTCYRGSFRLEAGSQTEILVEGDQAVVPESMTVRFLCEVAGTLQIIWAPPQGATMQHQ
jgi:hypothetical protein